MRNDLYNEQMLAWCEKNDHAGTMADFDAEATLSNPLCGDRVTIRLKMDADRIAKLRYQVRGCLLCKASCAHMAALVCGLDEPGLRALKEKFERFLQSAPGNRLAVSVAHEVFSPVRSRKSRHRCVLLPYNTALEALERSIPDFCPHRKAKSHNFHCSS